MLGSLGWQELLIILVILALISAPLALPTSGARSGAAFANSEARRAPSDEEKRRPVRPQRLPTHRQTIQSPGKGHSIRIDYMTRGSKPRVCMEESQDAGWRAAWGHVSGAHSS